MAGYKAGNTGYSRCWLAKLAWMNHFSVCVYLSVEFSAQIGWEHYPGPPTVSFFPFFFFLCLSSALQRLDYTRQGNVLNPPNGDLQHKSCKNILTEFGLHKLLQSMDSRCEHCSLTSPSQLLSYWQEIQEVSVPPALTPGWNSPLDKCFHGLWIPSFVLEWTN